MAFIHGKSSAVYVNGYDLSAYFKKAKVSAKAGAADVTVFGASAKAFIAGLKDAVLSLDGLFDGAVGAVNAVLNAALGVNSGIFTVLPAGDANGNPGYGFSAIEMDYDVDSPVDGVVSVSAQAQSSVGAEPLIVHHALANEIATTSGAGIDGGAASSNGGVGYLHVPLISGITNLAVVIQDSADGATGWATILTFAGVTANNASQRAAITGTVRRWTRYVATFTGVGNATFHVGFGRQ